MTHSCYRLSGAFVVSEIPLPAEPLAEDAPVPDAIVFRLAPALRDVPAPGPAWEERNYGVSVGRGREGFVVRFSGCAEFWIAAGGAEVVGAPLGGSPPATLAQLFLDQALPLALHARGRFTFHASAVALGGQDLVAFLGPSGAGKSTLASSLVHPAEAPSSGGVGARPPTSADVLFCDDCLAVEPVAEGILAYPSYPSVRLWAESAGALFSDPAALPLASPRTSKLRASLPAATESTLIRRLYLIESSDDAPAITRLPRREALMRLAVHLYRLDPRDRARLTGELDLLERVVSTVPVAVLAYRRAFAELPAVRRAIAADLTSRG